MRTVSPDILGPNQSFFGFEPNAARARVVETAVRVKLADSMAAIFSALAPFGAGPANALIEHIRSGPISPVFFAAYTELVENVFSDNTDEALVIANELRTLSLSYDPNLRLVTLDDRHLGNGQAERYRRLIDDDVALRMDLRALSDSEFALEAERVRNALALLERAAPELAGELRTLVREIVLVQRPGDKHFGASSFQIWGALFLRPAPIGGRVVIASALAHEAAHALLFGFGMGKPLVINDAAERFPSPLRDEPRPMDGVVHATYVLARMYYALTLLIDSGLLTPEEERTAREERDRHKHFYTKGIAEIETHAKWTEAGKMALSSARDYMASVQ
jgi:hypothetical protein